MQVIGIIRNSFIERIMYFEKLVNSQASSSNGITSRQTPIASGINFSHGTELRVGAGLGVAESNGAASGFSHLFSSNGNTNGNTNGINNLSNGSGMELNHQRNGINNLSNHAHFASPVGSRVDLNYHTNGINNLSNGSGILLNHHVNGGQAPSVLGKRDELPANWNDTDPFDELSESSQAKRGVDIYFNKINPNEEITIPKALKVISKSYAHWQPKALSKIGKYCLKKYGSDDPRQIDFGEEVENLPDLDKILPLVKQQRKPKNKNKTKSNTTNKAKKQRLGNKRAIS